MGISLVCRRHSISYSLIVKGAVVPLSLRSGLRESALHASTVRHRQSRGLLSGGSRVMTSAKNPQFIPVPKWVIKVMMAVHPRPGLL